MRKGRFLLLFPLVALLGLSACDKIDSLLSKILDSESENISASEVSSEEDPIFNLSSETSDVSSNSVSSITSNDDSSVPLEFIDYVNNGTVALDVDYKNRDFYVDGIGEMKLDTAIDGDTAHFKPVVTTTSSEKIKIRFYGIDTPESTGKIQPYGHAASVFTAEKLNNAKDNGTIVVSTPGRGYKVPEKDSTGSRYLGLVWINETKKNASFDELILLNLWIIQEGYSWINNLEKCPEFADTFFKVEAQSKAFKLKLFSGEPDPDFNYGDYETTSILDIKKEIEKQVLDPNYKNAYNNKKVRVVGTVAGYINRTLYLQCFYAKEDGSEHEEGEWAGINIYTGMDPVPARFTKFNTVIMVCGTALDSENFGFQISGCSFPQLKSRESDDTARVMISAEDNVDPEYSISRFSYTVSELNQIVASKDFSCLNCAVEIKDEFTVTDFFISDGGDITLYLNNAGQYDSTKFVIYIAFSYKGDPDNDAVIWDEASYFVGKTFTVMGVYTFHKYSSGRISMQICPQNSSQLVCTSL